MKKEVGLSLAMAGIGVATNVVATKYDALASKLTPEQKDMYAKGGSFLTFVGLSSALYYTALQGHPKRIAVAVIPLGMLMGVVAALSGFDGQLSLRAKVLGSVGGGLIFGGGTYLLTNNLKAAQTIGGAAAVISLLDQTKFLSQIK